MNRYVALVMGGAQIAVMADDDAEARVIAYAVCGQFGTRLIGLFTDDEWNAGLTRTMAVPDGFTIGHTSSHEQQSIRNGGAEPRALDPGEDYERRAFRGE